MPANYQLICFLALRLTSHTWKEASLEHSNEEPQDCDLCKVLYASKSNGENAPKQQQCSQPPRRTNVSLHDPVGRYFEQSVCHSEERDRDGVLQISHPGLFDQRVASLGIEQLGVSDVSSAEIDQLHAWMGIARSSLADRGS